MIVLPKRLLNKSNKEEILLKYLLCIYEIFAISCFIMPMMGVFKKYGWKGYYWNNSIRILVCIFYADMYFIV
jgi:hypothetical protein